MFALIRSTAVVTLLMGSNAAWAADTIYAQYSFRKEIFTNEIDPRYRPFRAVSSSDIVIFGNSVVIDKPIRSNGGDIIIVADRLHVAAPLDTRIYVRHPRDSFHDGILENAPDVNAVFDKYYGTGMEWQDDKKHFAPTHIPLNSDGTRLLPDLPAGTTGIWAGADIFHGTAAPEKGLVWDNLRSGNILIVAATIEFCKGCAAFGPSPFQSSAPREHPAFGGAEKDAFPECRKVFGWMLNSYSEGGLFIVKGINGGRGGIGGIYQGCKFDASAQSGNARFSCVPRVYETYGGVSGPNGYAGKGGNFEFFGMSAEAQGTQLGLVNSYVDSQDQWKSWRKLRTPPFNKLRQIQSRCAFDILANDATLDVDPTYHPYYSKKPGESLHSVFLPSGDSKYLSAAGALPYIWQRLRMIEARFDSSVGDDIVDSKQPLDERGLKPTELFHLYLLRNLNEARSKAASTFASGNSLELNEDLLWPLLRKQDLQEQHFDFDRQTQSLIRSIGKLNVTYESSSQESLYNLGRYFSKFGGVFNIDGTDPQVRLDSAAARAELNRINELLAQSLNELRALRANLLDILDLQTRRYYEQKLSDIVATIKALEQTETSPDSLTTIGELGSAAASAYAAFQSQQYWAGLEGVYRAFQLAGRLSGGNERPSSNAVRVQYAALEKHFSEILSRISNEKERLLERTSETYKRLRDANVRYQALVVAASEQFEPLLQRILLTYLNDGDEGRFKSNLADLTSTVEKFPAASSSFRLYRLDATCAGKPSTNLEDVVGKDVQLDCVRLPVEDEAYSVLFTHPALGGRGKLPAITISAGQNRAPVNFFGLISGRQIEKVTVTRRTPF